MAKSTKRIWTEEEIELLQKYYEEGYTYKEISKILNRSKNSICLKINELKHSNYQNSDFKIKGKWTEEEIELLQKYRNEGISNNEIASRLNRTVGSVESKILKLKYKKSNLNNRKKWTKEEEELLLQYYNEGLTSREIAKKLKRNNDSIENKLRILLNRRTSRIINEYAKNKNDESKKNATNHRKPWTEEEVLRLKEYIENGYSYEAIAEILGRTFESIRSKIREDKENG